MTEPPPKKPENIFEAVSQFEKKLHEHEQTEPAQEPLQALFQQCQKLHEELSTRIDREFERSGISERQYRAYINRPQNFSEKDWQRLQEQKAFNVAKLQRLIPHPTVAPPKPPEPEKPPIPQKPAPKHRPVTKRGWLEMR